MPMEMNPGSQEATDAGCACPVIDNHYGKGYGGSGERFGWIVNAKCSLHSPKKQEKPPTEMAEGVEEFIDKHKEALVNLARGDKE